MMRGVFSGAADARGSPRRGRWGASRRGRLSVPGLVCLMMTDGAACGSTENAMMTGKMLCSAAHQGAFNAPFGLGRMATRT
jgi:hypothetical protein